MKQATTLAEYRNNNRKRNFAQVEYINGNKPLPNGFGVGDGKEVLRAGNITKVGKMLEQIHL